VEHSEYSRQQEIQVRWRDKGLAREEAGRKMTSLGRYQVKDLEVMGYAGRSLNEI
jgi:hypothetical protein